MEQNHYLFWENQVRFQNSIATNGGQNLSSGNYFFNDNERNYDRYAATLSTQDLEAEILRLTLSSPANTSNIVHHTHGYNFFERGFEYPLIENGASNIHAQSSGGAPNIHVQSSSFPSSSIDIGLDYLPIRPRNDHGYRHERLIGTSTRINELDYNAMLRLIEGRNLSETQIIDLTNDHLHELMVDKVGSCFVQSLLRICDDSLINHLLFSLLKKEDLFVDVCLHNLGHRALVRLMDRLRLSYQQLRITSLISNHVVTLAKSSHCGHEVLKRCFLSFSREANELILVGITQNCLELVRDQAGCCILQVCIKYAIGQDRETLVSPLIQDAENLSRHAYGNYVIQFMIQLDGANIGSRIIKKLKNNFVGLSLNKHGSNVVEKCIMSCCDVDEIIFEIMENDEILFQVCTNEYGNYVVQRALSAAKGEANSLLVEAIRNQLPVLQFHPYGKNVIDALKRISKKSKSSRLS